MAALTMKETLEAIADWPVDGKLWDAIHEMRQLAKDALDEEKRTEARRRAGDEPSVFERVKWLMWYRATHGAGLRDAMAAWELAKVPA